jgi:hypothetical protein
VSFLAAVRIDGELIAGEWDGSSVVALSDLEINWGRNDIYEDVPPSTFQISFIDRDGQFASDNNLSGKSLWIEDLDQAKIILRGRIAEPYFTPVTLSSPDGTGEEDVWRVVLVGKCTLADLQQAIVPGPMAAAAGSTTTATNPPYTDTGPWVKPPREIGWWQLQRDNARLASVLSQGFNRFIDGIDVPSRVYTALGFGAQMPLAETPVSTVAEKTPLDLVTEIFHMYPLGHANFDAETNHLQLAQPATTAGLKLVLSGTTIVAEPVAGLTVPATDVQLPEGRTLRSTVSYAIDTVVVPWGIFDLANVKIGVALQTAPTARKVDGSITDRRLVIETAFWEQFGAYATIDPNYHQAHLFAQELAERVADLVDDVNGKFTMPRLRFDMRRWTYDPDLVDVLLDTKDHPVPLYFEGSLYANLPNVAAQYQIIGGRLRWIPSSSASSLPSGWVLDAIAAPATGTVDPESIDGLVTNPVPTFADFHPSITLATLGLVTQGLV